MAEATTNCEVVSVKLTLSTAEATVLRNILGRVGGMGPGRRTADAINQSLKAVGIKAYYETQNPTTAVEPNGMTAGSVIYFNG